MVGMLDKQRKRREVAEERGRLLCEQRRDKKTTKWCGRQGKLMGEMKGGTLKWEKDDDTKKRARDDVEQ